MNAPPYPKYKDFSIPWLRELPEDWKLMSLKHCIKRLGSGGTPESGNPDFWADEEEFEGIPWVAIGDMTDNQNVKGTQKKITQFGLASKGLEIFPAGSLLYSIYASLGKVATLGIDAAFNQAILAIIPNEEIISKRYLRYWLNSLESHLLFYASSNTQANLNAAKVLSYPVAIPSQDEQIAISNFLDLETAKIDSLIVEQERLIELLQEKQQADISHAVTKGLNRNSPMKDSGVKWLGEIPENWNTTKLNYIISTRKGVAFKSEDFCDEGTPVSKASDIKSLSLREASTYIAEEFINKFPKAVIHEGEIIISTVGSNPEVKNSAAGQLCMTPAHSEGNLLNQNTAVLTPLARRVDNRFLFFSLLSRRYRDHLDLSCHGTANQSSISLSEILDYWVALPPSNEQKEIVSFLTKELAQNNKLANEGKRMINLLRERRSALISFAVTGQIDVRGLVLEEE